MPRFLHTADLQIGRVYGQLHPDDAALVADERVNVVARMATIAAERTALEQLSVEIADQIVARVAVYARNQAGAIPVSD